MPSSDVARGTKKDERLLRVVHLVPSLDIGGVEVAVAQSFPALRERFDYQIFYVRRHGKLDCNQRSVTGLGAAVLRHGYRPDVVITSLWWSHPIGALLRLKTGAAWLAFFHASRAMHRADAAILAWAWTHCDSAIVDSEATHLGMARAQNRPARVVPYLFPAPNDSAPGWSERDIDVVWVGRNHPVKRLDLFSAFLRALVAQQGSVRATVVVAGGPAPELGALARTPGLALTVVREASSSGVLQILRRARFYALLSDHEGMSMSTVEAAQAGCVVVARRVGELPRYVGDDGVAIDDVSAAGLAQVASRVSMLWRDELRAREMVQRVRARLAALPTYVDALSLAIEGSRRSARVRARAKQGGP